MHSNFSGHTGSIWHIIKLFSGRAPPWKWQTEKQLLESQEGPTECHSLALFTFPRSYLCQQHKMSHSHQRTNDCERKASEREENNVVHLEYTGGLLQEHKCCTEGWPSNGGWVGGSVSRTWGNPWVGLVVREVKAAFRALSI